MIRSSRRARAVLAAVIVAALTAVAGAASAGAGFTAPLARGPIAAEPDSGVTEFLKQLSDSTDRYFGRAAAPLDTAGLDSALIFALANPEFENSRRPIHFSAYPTFSFNRVDGPTYGAAGAMGNIRRWGELFGAAAYAVGPNDWQGGGGYRGAFRLDRALWTVRLYGGINTVSMGRERSEKHLTTARALVAGADRRNYLHEEGVQFRLDRETDNFRVGVGYHNMLESPLSTTTTWNLTGRDISVLGNLAAVPGRIADVELSATWRLPVIPFTAEVAHHEGTDAFGGDFDYSRTRGSLAGSYGIGGLATLVPQFLYGHLNGDVLPQTSFYMGGSHSLRSVPAQSLAGSGVAVARLDLIGAADILALARIPHPDALPMQLGIFAGAGAVWGQDPYGGPTRRGVDWPGRENWVSEVGVSLSYQPGIPDPTMLMRINYAVPLGPDREHEKWTISFTRAIDLVRPLGN